jgi:8-oxo-dGTP pyrophosphatase MutT (NUDIX family)
VQLGVSAVAELASALSEHARVCPANAEVARRMRSLLEQAGAFSRNHVAPGHFTASAFVLCPERRRVLLIHHQKLGRWLQPGGHIEASDETLLGAARREVVEETGVVTGPALGDGIFDVDIHHIPASPKDGAHLHFDVRYAFGTEGAVADGAELVASPEVLGARWVELDAVPRLTDEESVLRCVERLRAFASSARPASPG